MSGGCHGCSRRKGDEARRAGTGNSAWTIARSPTRLESLNARSVRGLRSGGMLGTTLGKSAGIATDEYPRGLQYLGYLAQTGLICFGPREGKQHTFTLLDQWLPADRECSET